MDAGRELTENFCKDLAGPQKELQIQGARKLEIRGSLLPSLCPL